MALADQPAEPAPEPHAQALLAGGGRWEYTYDATGQLVGGVRDAPRWPAGIEQLLATYG